MYSNIYRSIEDHDVIIIHRHSKPDGDALGSQIGFKEAIKATFPFKQIYAVGDFNERLSFIGSMDNVNDEMYEKALILVLDTAEEFMISDVRYKNGKHIIKIDHHIPRSEFGHQQIVDTSFESCAGLVSDIIFSNNMKLSDFGARALFTGIVTDSGRFRYDAVSTKTFEITAKLLTYNFNINEVYNNLYLEDLNTVKLRAKFILNFQVTDWKVAYIKTTAQELKNYNADIFTISRGMVNTMGGIRGIDIWVNFTEDEANQCVIAEIRSSKYNINEIATKYGGGGHLLASGATLASFDEADLMLEDLNKIIKDNQ